jgi:hypothetical protein
MVRRDLWNPRSQNRVDLGHPAIAAVAPQAKGSEGAK